MAEREKTEERVITDPNLSENEAKVEADQAITEIYQNTEAPVTTLRIKAVRRNC